MPLTAAVPGGAGFVATGVQITPGGSGDLATLVSAVDYVPVQTNGLKAPFEFLDEDVMAQTPFSNQVYEPTYRVPAGSVSWLLNKALGLDFLLGALGGTAGVSASTVKATTATITTANGISTIAFASGAPTTNWAHVYINTDGSGVPTSSTEKRVILPGSTATSMKVAALVGNAATVSPINVIMPAQTKYAWSSLAAGHSFELPYLTVESNYGAQWSWLFGACLVDKYSIDITPTKVTATADLLSCGKQATNPQFANAGTSPAMGAWAPSTSDMGNALKPFTGTKAMVVYSNDDDASGTTAVRAALGVDSFKLAYDNKAIKQPVLNGGDQYFYAPGDKRSCQITFNTINTAKRNAAWEDLLSVDAATPVGVDMYRNNGTAALPVYAGMSIGLPNVKLSMADPDSKLGALGMIAIQGKAMPYPGTATELVQVYIL